MKKITYIPTGVAAFDHVIGGGLVAGSGLAVKTTEAGRQVYRKSLTLPRANGTTRKTLAGSIAINLLDDIDELQKELGEARRLLALHLKFHDEEGGPGDLIMAVAEETRSLCERLK